jgi:hypothetical protein
MERKVVKREETDPRMGASKRFAGYKKEDKKNLRAVDVSQEPCIKNLTDAFTRFTAYTAGMAVDDSDLSKSWDMELEMYKKAVEHAREVDYSSSDVERFSLILPQITEELEERGVDTKPHIGSFLSALANEGRDTEFTIHTGNFERAIQCLGYANKKDITIIGDVGNWLGYRMTTGTIHVYGNADLLVGYKMRGGRIFVHGNAKIVGEAMMGGEVHVEGEITEIRQRVGNARIYHKGKLVVDK